MKRKVIIKQSLFLLVLFGSVILVLTGIMQIDLNLTNRDLVHYIIEDSNTFIKTDFNLQKKVISFISGFDLDNPISILERHFEERKDNFDNLRKLTSYFHDPQYVKVTNPRIYIYNTYQLETYAGKKKIKPNVMMASYYLRDQLSNLDNPTMVETTDLTNNKFEQIPLLIRPIISNKITKYPNIELIIDIGRDLAPNHSTTLKIDNENYARFLFIVNDKYPDNVALANELSTNLNTLKPNLSRGIRIINNENTANLSLSKKIIIIKCGGQDNTLEEAEKSLSILAQLINKYLGDKYGET